MCTQHFGHIHSSHCSSGASNAGGCPQRHCKSHWSIQLQPVYIGPGWGWSVGCLHDCQQLVTGPAGRAHTGSGDCEDAGLDLGLVSLQANWLTQFPTAPLRTKQPQVKVGCPVQKGPAKVVPGGTISIGITSHPPRDCFVGMLWWNQLPRPWMNAQSDALLFLLASNDCTRERACQEVLPVCHL